MESVLDLLVKIQGFDDEVDKAESRLDKIPQEIARLENQIKIREEELKEAEDRIQQIKKTYKLKELEVTDNEAKMEKLNAQTFAVKTNEEYRAILSEIEFLKKNNREIEDAMLGLMEEEENLKASMAQIKAETQQFAVQNRTRIAELESESASLKEKKTRAKIDLENNFAKLPEDVRALYRRIAKSRGRAVCLISDNTCTGCYANVTHQVLNEVKKGNKIILCDNCGRILVYAEPAK